MQANKKIVEQGLKYGYIFRAADDQVATTAKRLTGVELVPIETNGLKIVC